MSFAILLLMLCSRCFRLIRGSPSPLLMPRYFGSHLHLLSLYFATKMHAEQFRAIIANLPLHQLCKYLCEKAQEDGSEVYGTLLWVPEEGRLALLDCLTASLESPPLTPRSAVGGDTAADAAGSSSPLQADAAGGSSTLPAASGSSSTLPSAGPASSADTGTLPHFGKDAADPPLRDPSTQDSAAAAQDATDPPLQDPVQDTTPDPLLSEGGNPCPPHLRRYHNHMGFSYDDWYDYWQRNGWWESMKVPPGGVPLQSSSASTTPSSTLPQTSPGAAPSGSASTLDPPLDKSAGDGDGAPGGAPASSPLPSDGAGDKPGVSFDSCFDDMPAGVYEKLGPYQVRRIMRVECQEECEECASGHCGAILDVSRPEKCIHKHRCKQCYRIFRAKQLQ